MSKIEEMTVEQTDEVVGGVEFASASDFKRSETSTGTTDASVQSMSHKTYAAESKRYDI
jgi:hypothetical protein